MRPAPRELSLPEVLLMLFVMGTLHIALVGGDFWHVAATRSDNSGYLEIASAIRSWSSPAPEVRLFWGFPYTIAGLTAILPVSPVASLVLISITSSAVVSVLVWRLYGGRVAGAMFGAFNYQWILASFDGGSEPLFLSLLFAGFIAARSGRWVPASLLASLATIVRPVGVIALICLAVTLASRRRYSQLAGATAAGLAVGLVCSVPVAIRLGSPFAYVAGYQSDWLTWSPVTFPFGALLPALREGFQGPRWMHALLTAAWAALGLVGSVALWRRRDDPEFAAPLPEALFCTSYVLFLLCYNIQTFTAVQMTRYFLPVAPLLLYSVRGWIPNDRRVLWSSAMLTAVLAAGAVRPLRDIFGF